MPLHFGEQKRLGVFPIAICRRGRDTEEAGRFAHGHAPKVPQLDQFGLRHIFRSQLLECVIEVEDFIRYGIDGQVVGREIESLVCPTAFLTLLGSGTINEYPTHRFGRRGEEVSASIPLGILLSNESNVGFVYEGRGL